MKFNNQFSKAATKNVVSVSIKLICAVLLSTSLTACRGGQVDEGCYWGPVPNEHRMQELKDMGVRTIVVCRLNPLAGEEKKARGLGLNYVHIPTGLFVAPPEEGIQEFLKVARNPALRPLYICDQVARDRTQFYAGIYGMVSQGWTADHASWQMYRNGLRHWWPWFYKFRRIIKDDEQEIHGETAFKGTVPQ